MSNLSNIGFSASFTVNGNISNHWGVSIPGIQVTRTAGSSTVSAFTDSYGNFRYPDVHSGTYSITPTQAGSTFSPAMRSNVVVNTLSLTNQNFVGSG